MVNEKTLEVVVSTPGVLPSAIVVRAANVVVQDNRVEVFPTANGFGIRAVWVADLERAFEELRRELGEPLDASVPVVLLRAGEPMMEPIMTIFVATPEKYLGDVMGDISRRRGLVESCDDRLDRRKEIAARVPLRELLTYPAELDKMTSGQGSVRAEFWCYEAIPTDQGPGPDEPSSAALSD